MIIEAVIVCVNYSDFLAHTLPANLSHFDNAVVVTDYKSEDSKIVKNLCDYYNVRCVQTDAFYEYGATINKARGINEGLKYLSKKDWVIQLDADIYLPPLFRNVIQNIGFKFDKKAIYGIDRFMCKSFEDYMRYLHNPNPQHSGYVFINAPNQFELGSRIGQYYGEGYYVIGYFQMWNPNGSGIHEYPTDSLGADRTDVLFTKYWDAKDRHLIPEIMCLHLESEEADMGANWFGRKTKKFGI